MNIHFQAKIYTYRDQNPASSNLIRPSDIYASMQHINIASDNSLSPDRCQVIIWSNAVILSIWRIKEHISMKLYLKFQSFHSRKWAWKYRLWNGGYFAPALICQILSVPFNSIDYTGSYSLSSWGTGRITWIHNWYAPRLNKRNQNADIIPDVDINVIECKW